jgi:hypothetical protein
MYSSRSACNLPTCIAEIGSNFAQSSPEFKREIRVPGLSNSTTLPDQVVQSIDSPMIVVGGNLLSYAPFSAARGVQRKGMEAAEFSMR